MCYYIILLKKRYGYWSMTVDCVSVGGLCKNLVLVQRDYGMGILKGQTGYLKTNFRIHKWLKLV